MFVFTDAGLDLPNVDLDALLQCGAPIPDSSALHPVDVVVDGEAAFRERKLEIREAKQARIGVGYLKGRQDLEVFGSFWKQDNEGSSDRLVPGPVFLNPEPGRVWVAEDIDLHADALPELFPGSGDSHVPSSSCSGPRPDAREE